jgi:hypothetical protein
MTLTEFVAKYHLTQPINWEEDDIKNVSNMIQTLWNTFNERYQAQNNGVTPIELEIFYKCLVNWLKSYNKLSDKIYWTDVHDIMEQLEKMYPFEIHSLPIIEKLFGTNEEALSVFKTLCDTCNDYVEPISQMLNWYKMSKVYTSTCRLLKTKIEQVFPEVKGETHPKEYLPNEAAKKIYDLWKYIEKENQLKYATGYLLEGMNEETFFGCIQKQDFSSLNQKGKTNSLLYTIYLLSLVYGKDWGDKAVVSIITNDSFKGYTLKDCQKATKFEANKKKEFSKLKDELLKNKNLLP